MLLWEEYMSGISLLLAGGHSWGTAEISTFRSLMGEPGALEDFGCMDYIPQFLMPHIH